MFASYRYDSVAWMINRAGFTRPEASLPGSTLLYTLKDFKNAKNEKYYFLNPEHF